MSVPIYELDPKMYNNCIRDNPTLLCYWPISQMDLF